MSSIDVPLSDGRFGSTSRRDSWWVQPLLTFLGLSLFLVYSTWAAFQGDYYRFGPYLSPFYSPELLGDPFTPGSADGRPGGPPGYHVGRFADPVGARRISRNLLLLSRRIL